MFIPAVFRHLCFCVLLLAFAACAPRADIMPKSAPADIGTDVTVLVGTTRARSETGGYHAQKRGPLEFAAIEVSIPPEHREGKVEIGGADPDPEKHFLTRSIQPLTPTGFKAEVARQMAANPGYSDEAFIFVHGFNNTMGDGVFRTAQIAADLRINALAVHYSWPSSGMPLGYPYDRDSVLYGRGGLVGLIDSLADAGARHIILVAHSLGSHLMMESLRQMALSGRGASWDRISGVALIAPDIDVDLFHAQADDIGTLPQPFLILASDRDPALRLSARLTGERSRLGNISSAEDIATLDVTLVNVSQFRDSANTHLTAVSSPTLIRLISETDQVETAFRSGASVRAGLIPGTILTVQNATEVILDPASALAAVER